MQKPNIESLFKAVDEYRATTSGAVLNHNFSKQVETIRAARDAFRRRMEQLGLAQHIDWTNHGSDEPAGIQPYPDMPPSPKFY